MSNILEIMECRSNSNIVNEINYYADSIGRHCDEIIRLVSNDNISDEDIRKIFETT